MMGYYGDHMSGWGWAFMGVGSVLFWAAVIFAVVVVVRSLRNQDRPPVPPDGSGNAEDTLRQRFARGDIDEREYRQRLDVLRTS